MCDNIVFFYFYGIDIKLHKLKDIRLPNEYISVYNYPNGEITEDENEIET